MIKSIFYAFRINLVLLFLFVILAFSVNFLPILAQSPTESSIANSSLISNFDNSQTQTLSNFTNNLQIKVVENSDNLELEYNILQTFGKASRGVFLSFPKNMDGIWTEFGIQSVQKTSLVNLQSLENKNEFGNIDFEKLKTENLQSLTAEKYDQIKEWNEFRLRIGNVDKILPKGTYLYQIKLKATKSQANKYNFQLIRDWNDQIGNFEIIKNGKPYCNSTTSLINQEKCSPNVPQIRLNPDKSEVSNLVKIWLNVWLYAVILTLASGFGYLGWFWFARDPDYGFVTDKPEFEPPNLLPWEAQFLVSDGKVDFQNTFLSYLLYLSNYKFIKIIGQNEQGFSTNSSLQNQNNSSNSNSFIGKIIDKFTDKKEEKVKIQILKPLPDLLPVEFNQAITRMESDGFEQGIYNSQINSSVQGQIEKDIFAKLSHFYLQGYHSWQISLLIVLLVIGGILWFFAVFDFVKMTFLVGNSFRFVIPFFCLIVILWLMFILSKFSKLTRIGAETKAFCQRYNYYITKVEQFKLDFSNNPQEGVQYYLKILPFAAVIGFLPQFQKYLVDLFPQIQEVSEISNSVLIASALNSTTFYSPPNSSSSSGSDTGWSSDGFDGGGGSW